ncbi:hypothetical protein [Flavobacterium sp.]|uniref:hypothetical protein n=1 Tax=Flavobacterium sp. TaxID=239 RepID=UPI001B5EC5BC|nr:hypothetical protein [Flavobacterium sp.]MBP6181035.1 hypothetical protein [Flavobacterium sp.]
MKFIKLIPTFCLFLSFNFLAIAATPSMATVENIYLNPKTGKDTNVGTKENPLKTLSEASRRVNQASGEGAITVYLSSGVYGMNETADFNPVNKKFSKTNRLIIRAEIVPNDINWKPSDMPILISTMPFSVEKNDKGEVTGGQNFGILIQNSHVTIQGLRVLGEPVHENPSKGILIRNYPIVWEGKNLEDLRITQCLFMGDKIAIPNHLAVLANGKALEVDHCVFYGVKDAVVMWNNPATESSMHHNLIIDSYGGVVWTWSATSDFKFYNNVISNANVLWILDKAEKEFFLIENSIIVGYNSYVNKGGGPQGFGENANPEKLKAGKDVILKKEGRLEIIEDQTDTLYLHIKPGTLGSNLGAGLFAK